jgi:hypothetical protein
MGLNPMDALVKITPAILERGNALTSVVREGEHLFGTKPGTAAIDKFIALAKDLPDASFEATRARAVAHEAALGAEGIMKPGHVSPEALRMGNLATEAIRGGEALRGTAPNAAPMEQFLAHANRPGTSAAAADHGGASIVKNGGPNPGGWHASQPTHLAEAMPTTSGNAQLDDQISHLSDAYKYNAPTPRNSGPRPE